MRGDRQPSAGGGVWDGYVERFHHERPGITETLLDGARYGDRSPYDWLTEPLGDGGGLTIDVACGSAPLHARLRQGDWIGLDLSAEELRRAGDGGAGPLVRAGAEALPLAGAVAGAVVCSMALMVIRPVEKALAEIARVLRPGAPFVALVPGDSPLTFGDRRRFARLLAALRQRRLSYPNDGPLGDAPSLYARCGLRVVADERRRFTIPIVDAGLARTWVRALYLPGLPARRLAAAERVARRWVGHDVGLPLRRIIAERDR